MTVLTDRWRLPWVAEQAESWCAVSAGAGETRVGEAARALLLRTTWHAQRLVSWTPHLRQFQARARPPARRSPSSRAHAPSQLLGCPSSARREPSALRTRTPVAHCVRRRGKPVRALHDRTDRVCRIGRVGASHAGWQAAPGSRSSYCIAPRSRAQLLIPL